MRKKSDEEIVRDEIIKQLTINGSLSVESLLNLADSFPYGQYETPIEGIGRSFVANIIQLLLDDNIIEHHSDVCSIANKEVTKEIILSAIDQAKGIVRIASVSNIVRGNYPRISNAAIGAAIYELLDKGIIDQDATFYFRKKVVSL